MRGWIIYKDNLESLKPEAYAIRRMLASAPAADIDLNVYRPDQIDILVNREDRKSVLVEGLPTPLPDFLLPRMGSGTTYFALAVIRHLERLGVPSFNPSFSIEVVKDKLYQLQILAQHHFPIPKTMLAKFPVEVNLVEKRIGFPVVVKAISGSRGTGVFLSPDKASFKDLMQFFEATNKGVNIIIQEFIESSHGQDLRVFTIGGRVASIMKRFSTDGSFKANYSRGGGVEPFEITPEIEWLALEVSRILNLDIAGIDLLFDRNGGYKICEVNSSPNFKGMEECCDVDIAQEIFKFIKVRLGR